MINSINSIPSANNIGMQAQGKVTNPSIPTNNYQVQNPNINGIDALAAYNQPAVSKSMPKTIQPAIPTVLQPEAIKGMEGDRIYNSMGELDTIVKRTDNYTTVYKTDIQAPNDAIRKIETFDNKTGKLVRVQENLNIIEKGKLPQLNVIEIKDFYPDSDKVQKTTVYYRGKLEMVGEKEYGPNGYEKNSLITMGKPIVIEEFGDTHISKVTRFDQKGQITSVETIKKDENTKQTVIYKNGAPAKVISESKSPIVNTTGKNPMADADLVPSQPYILGYDPKTIQGEKTYYSNGALDSISTLTENGGYMTHKFAADGNLIGIEDAKNPDNSKTILYYSDYYSVDEQIAKDVRKTTVFNNNGTKEVSIVNFADRSEKYAMYEKNGKLSNYIDIDKDGNKMMLTYDKDNNLIDIN